MRRIGLLAAMLAATTLVVPAASAQTSDQLLVQISHLLQRMGGPPVALPSERARLAEIELALNSEDGRRDKLDAVRRLSSK